MIRFLPLVLLLVLPACDFNPWGDIDSVCELETDATVTTDTVTVRFLANVIGGTMAFVEYNSAQGPVRVQNPTSLPLDRRVFFERGQTVTIRAEATLTGTGTAGVGYEGVMLDENGISIRLGQQSSCTRTGG
jgi:hypothetical protein